MFFTWIVNDVFHVTETYESALYTIQATFGTLLIVLIPVNLSLYRSRKKELEILSTAIHKVSEGDYSCRIAADEKSSLTPIYEDFNKMCGELESVQILRNDFINNYSHEFKTPITSINGFASLLLERELPEEERRHHSCRERTGKGQLLYSDAADKVSAGSKRMHIFRNTAYPLQTGKRGKCA